MRQQERPEIIRGHGHLQPVLCDLFPESLRGSGIMNQHVQSRFLVVYLSRKVSDRVQRRQIQFANYDITVVRLLDDFAYIKEIRPFFQIHTVYQKISEKYYT